MPEADAAAAMLEDCITAGDNREYALANIADDFEVSPEEVKKAFEKRFGADYLTYKG